LLQKTLTENRLGQLAGFTGTPEQFWPLYLDAVRQAFDSVRSMVLARGEQPWQAVLQSPADPASLAEDARLLMRLADQTVQDSPLMGQLPGGQVLLGIRLPVSPDPAFCVSGPVPVCPSAKGCWHWLN
jgi:hypothetical protein